MKVNFYEVLPVGNQVLAVDVELEVVPNGIYVIEGVEYTTSNHRPVFHIIATRSGHRLDHVDLLLMKL